MYLFPKQDVPNLGIWNTHDNVNTRETIPYVNITVLLQVRLLEPSEKADVLCQSVLSYKLIEQLLYMCFTKEALAMHTTGMVLAG
jgi:hypothetical protein